MLYIEVVEMVESLVLWHYSNSSNCSLLTFPKTGLIPNIIPPLYRLKYYLNNQQYVGMVIGCNQSISVATLQQYS